MSRMTLTALCGLALSAGGSAPKQARVPPSSSERSTASTAQPTPSPLGSIASPTFSHDIAPLIFGRCTVCHRPGGPAPFSFLNYSDVKRRTKQIAKVTQGRYMPPWLPEPGFGEFSGQRRLAPEQIALIQRWAEAGGPEGDPRDVPSTPKFIQGWQLGRPDIVVTMKPYTLGASGGNVFRSFVIRIPAQPSPEFIRAVEFRPDNPRVIHHALMRIDRTGQCRRLDERDAEPGFGGMDMGNAQPPDGIFLGWTPGAAPYAGHEGVAWRLEPGTDLVLQLHLVPSGKTEVVQPSIGLYFAAKPPTRSAYALVVQTSKIDIPAGRKGYVVEETFPLTVPVEVLSIYPHAHFLGKEMKIFATLPDRSTRWLLYIKDWDFNWQDSFRYAEAVRLPRGAVITMRYTYDNSADNPRNPNNPPKRVTLGLESTDEMASVALQLVTATSGDLDTLKESVWQNLVNKNPQDPIAQYSLGSALCMHGKLDAGIRHLREVIRLKPDYPGAYFNLGLALQLKGAEGEAVKCFSEALRFNPRDAAAFRSLAALRQSEGRLNDIGIRYAWGLALARTGRLDDAVVELREVLRLRPDHVFAINNLDAAALDALAAAYAAAGRFPEAVKTAQAALQMATAAKDERLAGDIRARLDLYRQSKPFRRPS